MFRKRWTEEEDDFLLELAKSLTNREGKIEWELLSEETNIEGHLRSKKQIMDRWNLQLNPKINKSPFSDEERKILFTLQEKAGNSWAGLTQHFNGRTQNTLKTQFFMLLRTALRKACIVKNVRIRSRVFMGFKPTIYLKLLKSRIIIKKNLKLLDWKKEFSSKIPWLRTSFSARKFIELFAFTSQDRIIRIKNPLLELAIDAVIDKLKELDSYHSDKKYETSKNENQEKKNLDCEIDRLISSVSSWVQEQNKLKKKNKLELSPELMNILKKLKESISKHINTKERSLFGPDIQFIQANNDHVSSLEINPKTSNVLFSLNVKESHFKLSSERNSHLT